MQIKYCSWRVSQVFDLGTNMKGYTLFLETFTWITGIVWVECDQMVILFVQYLDIDNN